MSDEELIARLRYVHAAFDCDAAADRIEALFAELQLERDRVKQLEAAIDATSDYLEERGQSDGKPYRWLCAALKGESHE